MMPYTELLDQIFHMNILANTISYTNRLIAEGKSFTEFFRIHPAHCHRLRVIRRNFNGGQGPDCPNRKK